ncbi:MAG: hypothetical protein IPJ85_09665 [Flavobacteriales bacterium]|nr:hypothetical protein [Flavobacteriales bacterium]
MAQASDQPVHTFSVVFDEEEYSEERFARIVAKKVQHRAYPIRMQPAEMLRLLPDALAAMVAQRRWTEHLRGLEGDQGGRNHHGAQRSWWR